MYIASSLPSIGTLTSFPYHILIKINLRDSELASEHDVIAFRRLAGRWCELHHYWNTSCGLRSHCCLEGGGRRRQRAASVHLFTGLPSICQSALHLSPLASTYAP